MILHLYLNIDTASYLVGLYTHNNQVSIHTFKAAVLYSDAGSYVVSHLLTKQSSNTRDAVIFGANDQYGSSVAGDYLSRTLLHYI